MCTRTYRDKVVKGGRMSLSKSGRGAKTIGGVGQRGMAPAVPGQHCNLETPAMRLMAVRYQTRIFGMGCK